MAHAGNTIYTSGPDGNAQAPGAGMAPLFKDASGDCADGWAGWQAAGMDKGSTIKPMPSADEIVAMGKTVLGVA